MKRIPSSFTDKIKNIIYPKKREFVSLKKIKKKKLMELQKKTKEEIIKLKNDLEEMDLENFLKYIKDEKRKKFDEQEDIATKALKE